MRYMVRIAVLPLLFLSLFVSHSRAGVACLTLSIEPEHVKRIVDGDTFTLYTVDVRTEEFVRVIPIDTPERGQPGYREAAQFTADWLKVGRFDMTACKRDSFGRLLADLSRDGVHLGDELVKAGLAVPWEKQ